MIANVGPLAMQIGRRLLYLPRLANVEPSAVDVRVARWTVSKFQTSHPILNRLSIASQDTVVVSIHPALFVNLPQSYVCTTLASLPNEAGLDMRRRCTLDAE